MSAKAGSRPARLRRWLAPLAATALALTGGTAAATAAPPAPSTPAVAPPAITASPTGRVRPAGDVIANLWEWNWPSIGRECTSVLGPKGYGGVQVAPPQDSLKRTRLGDGSDTVLHPWWEVYQPVRYQLTSRMGTEAQFKAMVSTCRKAGVRVYVDAVINHMTGQGSTSYGGVTYAHDRYRDLFGRGTADYRPGNFHRRPVDCPSASGGIENFNDVTQVHNCELVGLADLRTESRYVRTELIRYLDKLLRYGVSGFRVDAAKHIPQADLIAIRHRLRKTVDGSRPYWVLEVGPGSPGAISPQAYLRAGDLLGFDYQRQLKDAFKSYTTPATGSIASLRVFGERAGLLPSNKTLVFVHNHDTDRNPGEAVTSKDGATDVLAHQFLLAHPYGRPQVYASFTFGQDTAQSPPSNRDGLITDTDCSNGRWNCLDRRVGVANLVGFHNHVAGTKLRHWYDDGQNLIAFGRGTRGWISLNNATTAATRTFTTGLAAGAYCDLNTGSLVRGRCTGRTVNVDARGRARVRVPGKTAVALATHQRVG